MYTLFYSPHGKTIKNIDISQMKKYVIDDFENYWFSDTNDTEIQQTSSETKLNLTKILENGIINQGDKMDIYEKTERLNDRDFKQIIGVERATFDKMVEILEEAYANKPRKWRGGRKKKLTIEEQLMLTLKYNRQYVTQKELAFEFEVGEATVCDTIKWVEDTLVKDGTFSLPGKKALLEDDSIEVVLIDVTECPVERPQKNRKNGIPVKRNGTQ